MSIKPKLGLFDLTMIVVSLVIGMGIFRTPVEVAQKSIVPSVFFLAWTMGAVVLSLFGALTFAEIGSRYPAAGGFYRIFSYCYHPAFAFMVNWMTSISNAASTSIVAIIGAEYVNPILLPHVEHDLGIRITTISAIVILYGINLLGIKMSARALNVLMIIKISLVALLISAIFFAPHAGEHPATTTSPLSAADWLKSFWLCFVPVFFTYGGYQQSMNFGSDVPDAKRINALRDRIRHHDHFSTLFINQFFLLPGIGVSGPATLDCAGVRNGGRTFWRLCFQRHRRRHVSVGHGLRQRLHPVQSEGLLCHGRRQCLAPNIQKSK